MTQEKTKLQEAPPPVKEREDGKKMWIINEYKVWAQTYEQALQYADMIDRF